MEKLGRGVRSHCLAATQLSDDPRFTRQDTPAIILPMRFLTNLPVAVSVLVGLNACNPSKSETVGKTTEVVAQPASAEIPAPVDIKESVVRLNSTQQAWNPGQPWEKYPPGHRRALAAIVGPQQVLTTSELVADATYLEFESPDGTRFAQAKVLAVDYEANLALLGPASAEEGEALFTGTKPLALTGPLKIGDAMEILQVEENSLALLTQGNLRSVDVTTSFLDGHNFLTYLVKASMQSAASSFSLPVLKGDKLAGVLLSYNSKDQICEVVSPEIVARFLQDTAKGNYKGFPSLGIAVAETEDTSFRQWLKLTDDQGGLYVQSVRKGGSAETAGLQKGDVLLALDGHPIDRRGNYAHPVYGNVSWGHLIRGEKSTGDKVKLSVLRGGQPREIEVTLTREEESSHLIPGYAFGQAPNFLVKGGLIFQELTRPLLESFGKDWETRAPLDFLDALKNPEKYEGKVDRIVFLSGSIPTPATVGYESLRNLIVKKVNGKEIKNMKGLIEAFKSNPSGNHSIELDDNRFTIYLDEATSTTADSQLLQRGLSRLSRAD